MLKKAGIIVAASAAGILCVHAARFRRQQERRRGLPPQQGRQEQLEEPRQGRRRRGPPHKKRGDDGGDTSKDNVSNDCQFGNQGGSPVANATGGNSLLGAVGLVTSTAIDATSQLNTLNCNNINLTDLVDSDSDNDTTTKDTTRVARLVQHRQLISAHTQKGPDLTVRVLLALCLDIYFTRSIACPWNQNTSVTRWW